MPTVLVVEDDALNRALFTEFLSLIGYQVITAERGAEAIQATIAHEPLLILMDWHLPGGLDGIETARRIKSDPRITHIPIIIISADYEAGVEEKVLTAKCEGFFRKPLDIARLRSLVTSLIRS